MALVGSLLRSTKLFLANKKSIPAVILILCLLLIPSCYDCKSQGDDCDVWEDSYLALVADGKNKKYSCQLVNDNIVKYNESYMSYGSNYSYSDCVIGELESPESDYIEE